MERNQELVPREADLCGKAACRSSYLQGGLEEGHKELPRGLQDFRTQRMSCSHDQGGVKTRKGPTRKVCRTSAHSGCPVSLPKEVWGNVDWACIGGVGLSSVAEEASYVGKMKEGGAGAPQER